MWYVALWCIFISGCFQQPETNDSNLITGTNATYTIHSAKTPIILEAKTCSINHESHMITAEQAVVISNEYTILSDEAHYDREKNIIALSKGVIAQSQNGKVTTESASINTENGYISCPQPIVITHAHGRTTANKAIIDTSKKRVLLEKVSTILSSRNR